MSHKHTLYLQCKMSKVRLLHWVFMNSLFCSNSHTFEEEYSNSSILYYYWITLQYCLPVAPDSYLQCSSYLMKQIFLYYCQIRALSPNDLRFWFFSHTPNTLRLSNWSHVQWTNSSRLVQGLNYCSCREFDRWGSLFCWWYLGLAKCCWWSL